MKSSALRIGIDYTPAIRQGGGIGRYTRNLVRSLARLDAENQYRLLVAGGWGEGDGLGPFPSNFRVCSVPLSDRWTNILWQRLRLPLPVQAITGPLEAFHSPDFVLPPAGRAPTILTVHDLSFLRVPQFFVPAFRDYLEGAVARAVKRAWCILADSDNTRRDLQELMAVHPARVCVLYPGVEARFQPIRDPALLERARGRYDLPRRFILAVGTLQPRKNFDGLIDAFGRLMSARGDQEETMDLHLAIVGGKGWMSDEITTRAARFGLERRVHFPGFVRDEDLPALYTAAEVFAFPSWYEGFGLPVLEAMACGTPVVAANNSSLPEVVGNAGLMVDAADSDALAEALATLLTQQSLAEVLVAAGCRQAQRFSWEEAARQLLAIYKASCQLNGEVARQSGR